MSKAIENLPKAMEQAAAIRPKVGGFLVSPSLGDGQESIAISGLFQVVKVCS
jgi:hypothetical protein